MVVISSYSMRVIRTDPLSKYALRSVFWAYDISITMICESTTQFVGNIRITHWHIIIRHNPRFVPIDMRTRLGTVVWENKQIDSGRDRYSMNYSETKP